MQDSPSLKPATLVVHPGRYDSVYEQINGEKPVPSVTEPYLERIKPAKTGRRESQRGLPLHLGQRTAKLAACGHKVVATSKPSSGCFDCWHYFFSLNAKMVFACYDFLRTGREAEVRDAHGTKFVKQFKKYVMHVQSLAPIEPSDAVSAEVS